MYGQGKTMSNLNTSYVNLQRIGLTVSKIPSKDLNTSYVNLQHRRRDRQ